METKANYLAIGIFTIVVFAMSFGFIYWLERYGDVDEARELQLIMPASAGGLKTGSGVLFNGIRVGSVSSVQYRSDDPSNTYALLTIRSDVPLREDTSVSVEVQPLTGLSNVILVGGSASKPPLLEQEEMPVLRAEGSSLQDTIEAAGTAITSANDILERVQGLLNANTQAISSTVSNVEKFSTVLANNSDGIDQLLQNVSQASEALNSLGTTVAGVSGDIEKVITAIDPENVRNTLANVETITRNLAENSGQIDGIMDEARTTVQNFANMSAGLRTTADLLASGSLERTLSNVEGLTSGLNQTLTKVDRVVEAIDPQTVSTAMEGVNRFTERLNKAGGEIDGIIANAKSATQDVSDFTKSLTGNQGNIEKIISDATIISSRLTESSAAITRLIGRVDGLVEADGEGFVAEATQAATAIRRIAASFEARADDITLGLQRFSTRGLGDVENLINESRLAVSRIEGIVRKLENNPAQFLLSGESVPEYRPRR